MHIFRHSSNTSVRNRWVSTRQQLAMTRQVRDRIITQRQGLAVPKHASQVGFTAQRRCEQTRITMTVKGGVGVQHGQRKKLCRKVMMCIQEVKGTHCVFLRLFEEVRVVKAGSYLAGATLCAFHRGWAVITIVPRKNTTVIMMVWRGQSDTSWETEIMGWIFFF